MININSQDEENKTMKDARIIPIALPTPFAVGDVNIYLLRGEALTLVDAGPNTKEAAAVLKSELAEQGLSLSDIDQVVLTHHHADHAGLLDEFPAEVKSLAIRSMNRISVKIPILLKNKSPFTYLFQRFGVPGDMKPPGHTIKASYRYSCNRTLTETVSEGGQIEGLDGWRVLETPGHAASHIVLYNEELGSMLGETCC